jgi:hypothetical protein
MRLGDREKPAEPPAPEVGGVIAERFRSGNTPGRADAPPHGASRLPITGSGFGRVSPSRTSSGPRTPTLEPVGGRA